MRLKIYLELQPGKEMTSKIKVLDYNSSRKNPFKSESDESQWESDLFKSII